MPCPSHPPSLGHSNFVWREVQVRIKEHKYSPMQDLFQKLKLAQHAYEEGHSLCWNEDKAFQIGTNNVSRKHKEVTNMSMAAQPPFIPAWISPSSGLQSVKKVKKYNSVQFNSGSIGRVYVC
jgi:hypothetical protein